MRILLATIALICCFAASAAAQQPPPAAVPVGTVTAALKPIRPTADFVGRVQATQRVEVMARVTGYLESVEFTEGDVVKEGQPLYQIEKGLFQAAVDQAKGALEAAKAKKLLTAIQYERAEQLTKTSAGTIVARDQALTADRSADAQILIDQANLDTAQINLGYTSIASPINGKIGRTAITKGNVVSPQSGTLTTIVSQDPIYVLFPVSLRQIMRAREAGNTDDLTGIKVSLTFPDGTKYNQIGRIDFADVTADRATDAVLLRAVFPNPQGILIDGQVASVTLEAGKADERVVVPQTALISDQLGLYVLIVDDGKVAMRRVKVDGATGENMIIAEGLKGGEQVIVEGLQGVRPGTAVQARPVAPALTKG